MASITYTGIFQGKTNGSSVESFQRCPQSKVLSLNMVGPVKMQQLVFTHFKKFWANIRSFQTALTQHSVKNPDFKTPTVKH